MTNADKNARRTARQIAEHLTHLGPDIVLSLATTSLSSHSQKNALVSLSPVTRIGLIRRAIDGEHVDAIATLAERKQQREMATCKLSKTDRLINELLNNSPQIVRAAYLEWTDLRPEKIEAFVAGDDIAQSVKSFKLTKAIERHDETSKALCEATAKRKDADAALMRLARSSGDRNADEAARRAAENNKRTDDKHAALTAMRKHADVLEREVIAERAQNDQLSVAVAATFSKPQYDEQARTLIQAIKNEKALAKSERHAARDVAKLTKTKKKVAAKPVDLDDDEYRDALDGFAEAYDGETAQQRDQRLLADYILEGRIADGDDAIAMPPANFGHNVHGFLVETAPTKCATFMATDTRHLWSKLKARNTSQHV